MEETIKLTPVWKYNVARMVESVAFSNNEEVGVAFTDKCGAYVLSRDGKLLFKVCGDRGMISVSFSGGIFGFVNLDGYVYLADAKGTNIKKIYVGDEYARSITMTNNGFVVCDSRCAFFDLNGNKKWDIVVDSVRHKVSYYNGYWYIPDRGADRLLVMKNRKIVNSIAISVASDTSICGKYLAVIGASKLYIYELTDPEKPKEVLRTGNFLGGESVVFSTDCKYVATVAWIDKKLRIFDMTGNLVLEKEYNDYTWAVDWFNDKMAVGLNNGMIYIYRVEAHTPKELLYVNLNEEYDNTLPHFIINKEKCRLTKLEYEVNINTNTQSATTTKRYLATKYYILF